MENQHYIPKVYLKQFCSNTNKVFASQFIVGAYNWSTPKAYDPASICYSPNFYTLFKDQIKEKEINENILEMKSFWYEDKFITKLVQQIEKRSLNNDTIKKIPEFILNMLHRNPEFRKGFDKNRNERSFNDQLPEIKDALSKGNVLNETQIADIVENARNVLLRDNADHKFHTSSLLKGHLGTNEFLKYLTKKLQGYKTIIFQIKEEGQFFITTDSPGYSVDSEGKVFGIKFKDDIFHFFPMSSKVAIGLESPSRRPHRPMVSFLVVDSNQIKEANKSQAKVRSKFLYCESLEYLQILLGII